MPLHLENVAIPAIYKNIKITLIIQNKKYRDQNNQQIVHMRLQRIM
jgi:hypothetical protein